MIEPPSTPSTPRKKRNIHKLIYPLKINVADGLFLVSSNQKFLSFFLHRCTFEEVTIETGVQL
jgi:hypothetical protein